MLLCLKACRFLFNFFFFNLLLFLRLFALFWKKKCNDKTTHPLHSFTNWPVQHRENSRFCQTVLCVWTLITCGVVIIKGFWQFNPPFLRVNEIYKQVMFWLVLLIFPHFLEGCAKRRRYPVSSTFDYRRSIKGKRNSISYWLKPRFGELYLQNDKVFIQETVVPLSDNNKVSLRKCLVHECVSSALSKQLYNTVSSERCWCECWWHLRH